MPSILSAVATFIQPITLLAALVYAYTLLTGQRLPGKTRTVAVGALFGLGMIIAMGNPISLDDGYIFDLRNLVLFCSSVFFGPVVGAITLAFGAAGRLGIGGSGAEVAIVAMVLSYATGAVFHVLRDPIVSGGKAYFGLLGIMASSHLLVAPMLEQPIRDFLIFDVGPLFLILNFLGTILIGMLLRREESRAGEDRQLRADVELDPLTQLLNRRGLEQRAAQLKPGFGQTGHGVIFIDVDDLRVLNEKYGSVAGDEALRFVARTITAELRPTDLVGRTGGDEFAVILPEVEADVIKQIARRCLTAVRDGQFEFDGLKLNLTLSVGVHWGCEMGELDALLASADSALAAAKTGGRNRVAYGRASGFARPVAA